MATVAEVVSAVDRLAPFGAAQAWDNVGLLLGDEAWPAARVLVCLDLSEAVCDEAERIAADVVLAHHPLIFKEVDRLTSETRVGRLALRLAGGRRAVIAAHTNLDAAEGGLCDILAAMVGLTDLSPLRPEPAGRRYKVVVLVPEADLEGVRAAAFMAGAGRIGNYAECSFAAEGAGTFVPGEGAEPAVGEVGSRSTVREARVEFLVPGVSLARVLAAVGRAHPYEEAAIDVYPLHSTASASGIGRIGRLEKNLTAGELAMRTKAALGMRTIALAGDPAREVERVAVVTGGGGGLAEAVAEADCQAFVTGELKHHETEDLAAAGIAVILGGHWRTERLPLERWAPLLAEGLDGVEVRMSEAEREIVQLL
jgi:dinuclear metal center YbgI/SA1388 family protein